MGSSVHVKEALLIAPASPTPTRILSLSALDSQLFIRFTIKYLLVYICKPGSDRRSTVARVKAAFSRALVPYYPLAGRVRAKKFGSGLEVVCRSQGALFVEAVSDFTIDDFGRAPKYVAEWRELLAVQVDDVLKGAPPLVVQLTWLKDGNAALAVGVNHCISDGIGSCEFLTSFSESAQLGTKSADFRPNPVWERHLLDPVKSDFRKPNRVSHTHPEFGRVPDLCGFLTRFNNERLAPTSIVFDNKSLQELKKLASTSELKHYTSFEVLSAHVWRSWATALNFPPNQTLKLLFSIDFRDRVEPSLPGGYYGNAFVLGCAQTTVKELTEMGLGDVAMLVKRAKERVGSGYVDSVLESVSESGQACPDPVGVLILSQWSRLGLDGVDFGLGRPAHVSPVCCDRYCLFLPVADRVDAVKVMLAVPASGVEEYELLVRRTGG